MKKVLVLFERSGAASIPFREAGFDVTTIDIEPHMKCPESHIIHDIRNLDELNLNFKEYSLLIAFPPCTYFSKAGLHYLKTEPGDIVLDVFSGSGTTAVACINTGRHYICCEKNEAHWKTSVDRINCVDQSQQTCMFTR